MTVTQDTVADRIELARIELTPARFLAIVALAVAVGFTLLFAGDPLVHDSLHDFRHSVGITCH